MGEINYKIIENVEEVKKFKDYLLIIIAFDILLGFFGFPSNNATIAVLVLIVDICFAIICGITYYKITDKKVFAVILGISCLFIIINTIIAGVIFVKANNFVRRNKTT